MATLIIKEMSAAGMPWHGPWAQNLNWREQRHALRVY
jgi:hypothetical protein